MTLSARNRAGPPSRAATAETVEADAAEALLRAPPGGAPALLRTLAEVDPQACAELLVRRSAEITGQLTPEQVRSVLDQLARAPRGAIPAVGASGAEGAEGWRALLTRHGDAAGPDALAAAARELGPAAPELLPLLRDHLGRRPAEPGLLRLGAELARAAGHDAEAHALLTRLGEADLSLATVTQVLRARSRLAPPDVPPVRAALLGSFTLDPLLPYLDLECRRLGLAPELWLAPFGSWERELRSPDGALARFAPEIVFLAASIDDLVPELAGAVAPEELEALGSSAVARVVAACRQFSSWCGAPLVVHGFHSVYPDPLGGAAEDGAVPRGRWLASLNQELSASLVELPRIRLLDVTDLAAHRAGGRADNAKLRHLASMRLGEGLLPEVAAAYARYIAPLKGLTRKCVVLDLDNTLWGGVVGEDGPGGIALGDLAPGSEYREFQRYLRGLVERGILLAIASKNNPADALEVIRSHDGMVLREADFAAVRINWLPKPDNLRSIAQELGIGTDALVFVDDNPAERELMRRVLPEVLTPELPADPTQYRWTLDRLPQLHLFQRTEADRTRAQQYRARREREVLRVASTSLDDFLHGLGVRVSIAPANDMTLARVHQLVQRTNQFNLTARRYSPAELAERAADRGWRVYTLRAADRYSDHGLVAVAVVRASADEWTVATFLMSCRVIGYGIETALLSVVVADARAAGAAQVVGECIETPKNAPARDFYARHGFQAAPPSDGVLRWSLAATEAAPELPSWITVDHDA